MLVTIVARRSLQHDLLDVVRRQTLAARDLATGYRPVVRPTGQMKSTDEAVFGLCSDAHADKSSDGRVNRPFSRRSTSPAAFAPFIAARNADLGHLAEVEDVIDLVSGNHLSRFTRSRTRMPSFTDCLLISAALA